MLSSGLYRQSVQQIEGVQACTGCRLERGKKRWVEHTIGHARSVKLIWIQVKSAIAKRKKPKRRQSQRHQEKQILNQYQL